MNQIAEGFNKVDQLIWAQFVYFLKKANIYFDSSNQIISVSNGYPNLEHFSEHSAPQIGNEPDAGSNQFDSTSKQDHAHILDEESTSAIKSVHETGYRADIDGLRAVAIVVVIVFHAFPDYLPGGFIGVDIFFVISGYLISQIIIKQTKQDTFSYINFYSRRIKRIYPALIIVLSFTIFFVSRYSQNDQILLTFNTLKASTIFGANIQVMMYKKGYFDLQLRANPLLHLWSLGVEEQFYIIWPVFQVFVNKYLKKWALSIVCGFAIIYFVFEVGYTEEEEKFAFYFPFCRFWQMMIGGILAGANLTNKKPMIKNLCSMLGMIAISVTAFVLDESNKFPGYWALIPTLSAGLIIQSKESLLNKYLLQSRILVWIGKISYSLYLWHWPFLILGHTFYPYGSKSVWGNTAFILLVVVLVSVATYWIVQNPVRRSKSKKWAFVLFLMMAGVLCVSIWVEKHSLKDLNLPKQEFLSLIKADEQAMKPVFPQDYYFKNNLKIPNPSKNQTHLLPTAFKLQVYNRGFQYNGKFPSTTDMLDNSVDNTSVYWIDDFMEYVFRFEISNEGQQNLLLLIGDSHNLRITHRFQHLYKQSLLKFSPFPTLISIVKFGMIDQVRNGQHVMNKIIEWVAKHRPQRILITKHWLTSWCKDLDQPLSAPHNCNFDAVDKHLNMTVDFINALKKSGSRISLTDIAIHHDSSNPKLMIDANGELIEEKIQPLRFSEFKKKFEPVIRKFYQAIKPLNVQMITFTDNHCWNDLCFKTTPSGHPIFQDFNHYGKLFVKNWLTLADHLAQF